MQRNILTLLWLACLSLSGATLAAPSAPAFNNGKPLHAPCIEAAVQDNTQPFPCSAIVEFDKDANVGERSESLSGQGLANTHEFKHIRANEALISDRVAYLSLRNASHVRSIIPNRIMKAHGKPGGGTVDSAQITPPNIVRIGASVDARGDIDGTGIGIAIVDTGIDLNNTDLRVSRTCFTTDSSCQDGNGHGTHVSGIAAALSNSIGVVGVAPGATVYPVKVLDNTGSGSDATVMQGLEWILANAASVNPPIRVANASLGRPGTIDDNPALRSLIQDLKAAGIALVVSAGNDSSKEVSQMVPSGYPEVVAVASTTATMGARGSCRTISSIIPRDVASYFTTDGALNTSGIGVTISAPGEESETVSKSCQIQSTGILSLARGGGTIRMSGTSMAAPHVTGSIALYLQQAAAPVEVDVLKSILRSSSFAAGSVPLNAITSNYTFDGEREGVLSVCGLLGKTCP